MAAENVKSIQIVNEDAQLPTPLQQNTSGEWSPGNVLAVDGYCTVGAVGIASIGCSYRLVRFPIAAKVKNVVILSPAALDSNATSTLTFDFNVAFSDSLYDNTNPSNTGLIPTTAGAGATTSVATYSSPNKFWGNVAQGNNVAFPRTDITFKNTTTFTSTTLTNGLVVPYIGYTSIPLWKMFTFVNAQGYEAAPTGFWDLLAYNPAAAATGAAGSLYAKVEYEM